MKIFENIVLIGFMGCGKSAAGSLAAKSAARPFFETDGIIETVTGMTVSEIFNKYGEPHFRKEEAETVIALSRLNGCIIATGGGVVKNPANIEHLRKNGIIVYLKASAEKIYSNIKDDDTRPLLAGGDKPETIKKLLAERSELYESCCDVLIDVNNLSVKDIAREIVGLCGGCE